MPGSTDAADFFSSPHAEHCDVTARFFVEHFVQVHSSLPSAFPAPLIVLALLILLSAEALSIILGYNLIEDDRN